MKRDELIEVMARGIGKSEGSGPDDAVFDRMAAEYAMKEIEAAGMRVVPVEPTEWMDIVGRDITSDDIEWSCKSCGCLDPDDPCDCGAPMVANHCQDGARNIYLAMIKAAQEE